MEKEKVVFFLDYANINRAAREKRYRMDYADLLHYVGEQRFLVEAYSYVPINPRNEHRLDGEIEGLWRSGYMVNTKLGTIAGGTYKCNFDVEIAMDVLRVVYQVKPTFLFWRPVIPILSRSFKRSGGPVFGSRWRRLLRTLEPISCSRLRVLST